MRAFIAATAPPEVAAQLESCRSRSRRTAPKAWWRWTRAGQFHLTLRFLGTIPGDGLPELELALQRACQGNPSPHVQVERLFSAGEPSARALGGFSGDVAPLCGLQHRIAVETRGLGEPQEDRSFHPHLTLGRVNKAASGRGTAPSRSGASNH